MANMERLWRSLTTKNSDLKVIFTGGYSIGNWDMMVYKQPTIVNHFPKFVTPKKPWKLVEVVTNHLGPGWD